MAVKEKENKKSARPGLVRRFAKGSRLFFLAALVSSMLATMLNAITPQIIRTTVDSVIGDKPFTLPAPVLGLLQLAGGREGLRQNLWVVAVAILVVSLLSGLCTFSTRVTNSLSAEGFIKRLRDTLFDHIQKLPYSWHVRHQTGDIIQRCTSDVEVVRGFVANQLMEVFRTTFLVVFAMSIMFSMNLKLSLIALGFIPVVIAYSGIYYSKIAKRFRVADEAEGALSAAVQENLTGVRVVRAFGREAFEIERFDEKNRRFTGLWVKLGYVMGSYWGIGDFFTGLQIAIIIVVGTVEAVHGDITLGDFLAFIFYNSNLVWPIRGLGRILSEMSKTSVSMERLRYILDAEEEKDTPGAKTPPLDGDIVFDHVSFDYTGESPVLRDVSFTIPAGCTFAILGATGSGKSTLVHLLNRLYELPQGNGRITIGGVDIREISLSWLRSHVGMVLQEPFLFSRTIRENIAAFRPGAAMSEVRAAANIACVDDAVQEFAGGYDTIVGERGVTLSGGQKQRVAIARMLMQQAPIIVFDDSLSAVDTETDSKIRAELRKNLGRSTVILISHRVTTLMQADTILVLEDGRIAQLGSHRELLGQEGLYKRIYEIQMRADDRAALEGGGD